MKVELRIVVQILSRLETGDRKLHIPVHGVRRIDKRISQEIRYGYQIERGVIMPTMTEWRKIRHGLALRGKYLDPATVIGQATFMRSMQKRNIHIVTCLVT